jgi:hypothetical protein
MGEWLLSLRDKNPGLSHSAAFAASLAILIRSFFAKANIIVSAPFYRGRDAGGGSPADKCFGLTAATWLVLDHETVEKHA